MSGYIFLNDFFDECSEFFVLKTKMPIWKNKINVVLSGSGASDLVSYLVVKSTDKEKSVRVIYDAFFSPS